MHVVFGLFDCGALVEVYADAWLAEFDAAKLREGTMIVTTDYGPEIEVPRADLGTAAVEVRAIDVREDSRYP